MFFPLPFSLALLCCIAVSNAAGDEAAALLAIKASLVDPLEKLGVWTSASVSSHCTWEGVRCNARGVVTGLNLAGMNLGGIIPDDIPKSYHVREEMLLVLRIAVLCTAKSPKDRPTMRDVVTMLGEAKPRCKSSSATVAATAVDKDKPVFTTSPDSGYL